MKNTKPKVRLWSVLTGLTAILTVAAIVGNIIANQYATTLNVALNASTYKIIHGENTGDTEYFKKGFASDEEREAYEAELCATVEAEGAALLKNENNALPLASGAKVSLFGHGSVDLMYGGTGSGSVDTSKAPNLKQALEAQGITINQTLWDLYSSDSMMSKYSRMTPASISDTLEANTQYAVNEAPWSALSGAESSFAEYGDAAIVVLSRSGGEGADLPSGENGTSDSWISGQEGDGNYLALSAEEIELLQNLKALKDNGTFKSIVVLINSSNAIELDFLNPEICGEDYGIDAAMWIGDVGQTGINGVGQLLSGAVTPSGSLVDTYLYDNMANPAMYNFYTHGRPIGLISHANASSINPFRADSSIATNAIGTRIRKRIPNTVEESTITNLRTNTTISRASQIGKSKALNIFFISSALLCALYIHHLHLFGKDAALRKKRGRSCRCFGAPPAFQFSPLSFSKSRAICSSIRSCLLLTPRMSISSITPTSFALLAIWLTLLPM